MKENEFLRTKINGEEGILGILIIWSNEILMIVPVSDCGFI